MRAWSGTSDLGARMNDQVLGTIKTSYAPHVVNVGGGTLVLTHTKVIEIKWGAEALAEAKEQSNG